MTKSIVNRQSSIRQFFDSNALWLSMLIGAVGYRWFLPLAPILPWLIFFMLFFTFCKVNPMDLRLHKWHWVVLAVQMVLSLGSYAAAFALTRNQILAQGVMLCFIMPTASAAPIIAGKLGGSIQNLTTFTLLSNFATTLVVPALFPLINNNVGFSVFNFQFSVFVPAFTLIFSHITPLLVGPFLAAWLLRLAVNHYYRAHGQSSNRQFVLPPRLAQIPFYLWVASIIVLTASVTETTISTVSSRLSTILILLGLSFLACLMQFALGKLVGYRLPAPDKGKDYQDVLINPAAAPKNMNEVSSITAGQAFGQKNTSLGVWMAQTYLDPLSALGAAAYIIWQNLFNSAQLFLASRKK